MSKARTLAGVVSTGAVLADGVVDASEIGSLTLPSGGDIVGTTAVQTLTNKTIDIANNTLTGVQASLVSGTSIKTVNSTSLLGSGDVAVQPTLVSGTNIKTINGGSVLGSGDIAVQSGAWTYIGSVSASASSTVDLTGIDDTFDYYAVVGERIVSSTSVNVQLQLFINGSVIDTGSYSFHTTNCTQSSTAYAATASVNRSHVVIASNQEFHASFTLYLSGARASIKKVMHWTGVSQTSTVNMRLAHGSAMLNNTGLVTGIRFFQNTGNITSGNFHLYGIRT